MSGVTNTQQCPICHSEAAQIDLITGTDEHSVSCRACGYCTETTLIEHALFPQSFWKESRCFPMTSDGKVIRNHDAWLEQSKAPKGAGGGDQ